MCSADLHTNFIKKIKSHSCACRCVSVTLRGYCDSSTRIRFHDRVRLFSQIGCVSIKSFPSRGRAARPRNLEMREQLAWHIVDKLHPWLAKNATYEKLAPGQETVLRFTTPVPFKVFVQRVVAVDGDNTEDWVMFRYNGPGKSETQTAPWAQRFKAGEGFYQTILPYLRKATIGDSR
jgi:hypothetical protein